MNPHICPADNIPSIFFLRLLLVLLLPRETALYHRLQDKRTEKLRFSLRIFRLPSSTLFVNRALCICVCACQALSEYGCFLVVYLLIAYKTVTGFNCIRHTPSGYNCRLSCVRGPPLTKAGHRIAFVWASVCFICRLSTVNITMPSSIVCSTSSFSFPPTYMYHGS